jgi:hypothetical protein
MLRGGTGVSPKHFGNEMRRLMTVQDRTRLTDEAVYSRKAREHGVFPVPFLNERMLSMKRRLFPFLLAILMILPTILSSCANYSVEDGSRTYTLSGSGIRKRITVSENGKTVWKTTVKTSPSVGRRGDTYGLSILDLNFDGINDIKLITDDENDVLTEVCYLWNPTASTYEESEALSQLTTIGTVADQQLVLSYLGKTFDPVALETVETVISYRWQGDGLIPYRRLSITYYHTQDYYCYSVSDYLLGSFRFDESEDQWLTPEQFNTRDWSFFYYFK